MFDEVMNMPPFSYSMTQKTNCYTSNSTAFRSSLTNPFRILLQINRNDIFLKVQLNYLHQNRVYSILIFVTL